jgi:hypothetical protein
MKTFKRNIILICLLVIGSCQKTDDISIAQESHSVIIGHRDKENLSIFLEELKRSALSITADRNVDPFNEFNAWDFWGQYFSDMLSWMQANYELHTLPPAQIELLAQAYMIYNPLPTTMYSGPLSSFEQETLATWNEIIYSVHDPNTRIQQMKYIETTIASSDLYSESEKQRLLSIISSYKYFEHNKAIGIDFLPGVSYSCVESRADELMGMRMEVIFNPNHEDYNVVDSIAFVLGCPASVAWAYAACVNQAIDEC